VDQDLPDRLVRKEHLEFPDSLDRQDQTVSLD